MEQFPVGFVLILFGIFLAAVVVTIGAFLFRQRNLQRLKHPRKDYLKDRG